VLTRVSPDSWQWEVGSFLNDMTLVINMLLIFPPRQQNLWGDSGSGSRPSV